MSCLGRNCEFRNEPEKECRKPSTHKVGEEIMHDDPNHYRHNLTAYVCCDHFRAILGDATECVTTKNKPAKKGKP